MYSYSDACICKVCACLLCVMFLCARTTRTQQSYAYMCCYAMLLLLQLHTTRLFRHIITPTPHHLPLFTFSLLAYCRWKMHFTRFHCTTPIFWAGNFEKAFDGFSLLICNSTLSTVFVVPLHHTIIRFSLYLSFAYFLALFFFFHISL